MNKQLTEHYTMWTVTETVVDENNLVWAGNAPFTSTYNLFKSRVDHFETLLAASGQSSTGVSADKLAAKLECASQTDWLAARIRSYAGESGNKELYKQADTTLAKLTHMREGILGNYAQTLHDEATDLLTELTPFGVSSGVLQALQGAISAFRNLVGKPRGVIAAVGEALSEMEVVDKEIMELLTLRLDNDVKFFAITNPAFVGQYMNGRQIVNLPTHTRALDMEVKDSVSLQPIAHVDLRIMPGDIRRRSSLLGRAQVQNLLQGEYTVEATLPGYQPQVKPITVVSGQTTVVELLMVAV